MYYLEHSTNPEIYFTDIRYIFSGALGAPFALSAPFGFFKNHYQREYWQKEAKEYPYNPYLNNRVSWNIVFPVLDKNIVAIKLIPYIYIYI